MKRRFWIFLSVIFLVEPAGGQTKFEPTGASYREALANGQVGEYVAAMEALGSRAEMEENWAKASYAYSVAAGASVRIGQLERAMFQSATAVELALKVKDPFIESSAMLRLADIHGRLGQWQKEMEWLEKAQTVLAGMEAGTSRDHRNGRLYRQLGESYLRRGEIKKAIDSLSHSVTLLDAGLSHLVSTAAAETKNFENDVRNNLAASLHRLGTVYLQADSSQEAIDALKRGHAVLTDAGIKSDIETSIVVALGDAFLVQKDFESAKKYLDNALQLAEQRRQVWDVSGASSRIGAVFLQTGRPSEALSYYKKAIDIIESTRAQLGSEDFRAFHSDRFGRTYGGIIRGYLETNNAEDAFNYNERARSRAFLDILGSKVQLSRDKGGLQKEDKALKARSAETNVHGVARMVEEMMTSPENKIGDNLRFEQNSGAVIDKARREYKEQVSLMSVEPLKMKEVQSLLEPGQTVIEYFITPEKLFVWVVSKDDLISRTVAISQAELAMKVDTLRRSIAELKPLSEYQVLAKRVHELLIRPVLPCITGPELIVVPHGVLHYLPFQALYSSEGRYLVEDYSVSYLTSASLMQFTKEKRKAQGKRVLAFGNPDLGKPSRQLKFAEQETGEIKKLFASSTLLLRKEATKRKAIDLASQYDILHFAAHAELRNDDPLSSAILLAQNGGDEGRLEVRDIFAMDLNASLVVLSGCETGLGKLSSGDEFIGLTRAFIYAGTPSVVASLWKVDDSSTAHLMSSFYKNLKTMSKVEALRQAQLALIRGEGRSDLLARRGVGGIGKLGEVPPAGKSPVSISVSTSHPYFWAPFILVGDGK